MSWAADNPKKYGAILRAGVATKLEAELKLAGFDNMDRATVWAVVKVLQRETSGPSILNAWNYLTTWAHKEVGDLENDWIADHCAPYE